jgi:parallel beta-helix repeat protein
MNKLIIITALWLLCIPAGLTAETYIVYPYSQETIQDVIDKTGSFDDIIIKEGIYTISESLSISGKSGLTVMAEGEVWILSTDIYMNVIDITDSEEIMISNIKARHKEPLEEYECQGSVLYIENSRDISIFGCELNGSGAVGINLYGSDNIFISGCYIHQNSWTAINISECRHISIYENTIVDNAAFLSAYGVENIEIYGNVIAYNAE